MPPPKIQKLFMEGVLQQTKQSINFAEFSLIDETSNGRKDSLWEVSLSAKNRVISRLFASSSADKFKVCAIPLQITFQNQ
jgi:hypothetical protein